MQISQKNKVKICSLEKSFDDIPISLKSSFHQKNPLYHLQKSPFLSKNIAAITRVIIFPFILPFQLFEILLHKLPHTIFNLYKRHCDFQIILQLLPQNYAFLQEYNIELDHFLFVLFLNRLVHILTDKFPHFKSRHSTKCTQNPIAIFFNPFTGTCSISGIHSRKSFFLSSEFFGPTKTEFSPH